MIEEGQVDVAGHSYGGFLALLAKKHPEKIRKMALFEPTAWGVLTKSSRNEFLKKEFKDLCGKFFGSQLKKDEWLQLFLNFWNGDGFWEKLRESNKKYWMVLYPKIYAEVKALCFDELPLSHWADLIHPVRVFQSECGPPSQGEVCQLLDSILEKGDLIKTPGGHIAPLTHEKDINPLFAEWFI